MKKPGIITLASIAANLVLVGSLVHVYQTTSDTAFKTWVDQNLLSTFTLVLSGSIIAGSTFGYFLLRRKAPSLKIGGRLPRASPHGQTPGLARPSGLTSQSRNVPIGPPPGPASKHTAYAVPPLSKTPSQSRQPPSWSSAPKQWTPATFRAQRQEPVEAEAPPEINYPPQQILPPQPLPPPSRPQPDRQPTGQIRQPEFTQPFPPAPIPVREQVQPDQPPRWAPQQGSQPVPPLANPPYQGGSSDAQKVPSFLRQPIGPGAADRQQGFAPTSDPNRRSEPAAPSKIWNEPAPSASFATPQKWLPPSASPVPRAPPPIPSSFGPRPQNDSRQNFPGAQGTPRPLGYAGPLRPSQAGEAPKYQERRPPMPSGVQPSGVVPRPGLKPGQSEVLPPSSSTRLGVGAPPLNPASRPEQPERSQAVPPPAKQEGGGELDWDTALDAILKTLRKDKVEDKP